jgi:hypothetical protein|nr:MAG TPA: DNA-packaging protein [Bacteriophage sp.]
MARKPKLDSQLVPRKNREMVYNDLETCKTEYLDEIRREISEIDFDDLRCNKSNFIEGKIIKPMKYFVERKGGNTSISAEDLMGAMDTLRQITLMLSESTRFQPTIYSLCKMLSISTQTFNNWTYENNDKGEVARQIQDWFKSILVQGMLTGEYDSRAGAFLGKAVLGMKEDDGSQTNINIIGSDMKLEDILADYQKNLK